MRACVWTAALTIIANTTAGRVDAQWYVGLGLTATHYRGAARDTSGNPNARPGDATMVGVRFERSVGHARVGLHLSYGKPGFSLTGHGLTSTDLTASKLFEEAAPVKVRV